MHRFHCHDPQEVSLIVFHDKPGNSDFLLDFFGHLVSIVQNGESFRT